jgi:hypothetical protein
VQDDNDIFTVGPAVKRRGSAVWAAIRDLQVGEEAEFKEHLWGNRSAVAGASRIARQTGRVFGHLIGVREQMRVIKIKRIS